MGSQGKLDDGYLIGEIPQDINMAMSWVKENFNEDVCPCLASTSRIWMHRRRRELWGGEALSLQGLHWTQFKPSVLAGVSHRRLMDLAGNAFSGFCLAPLITAALAMFPWPCVGARVDLDDLDSALLGEDDDETSGEEEQCDLSSAR